MTEQARRLILAAAAGEATITTCDAVLAEVVYVLQGRVYQASVEQNAERLDEVLTLPGFRDDRREIWRHGLHLWTQRPSLGFTDCLCAAYADLMDARLATFDKKLQSLPGIQPYIPETS